MSDEITISSDEITISSEWEKDYKSIFKLGGIDIMVTKKFNWFQKKMIKLFFGFEVVNYER